MACKVKSKSRRSIVGERPDQFSQRDTEAKDNNSDMPPPANERCDAACVRMLFSHVATCTSPMAGARVAPMAACAVHLLTDGSVRVPGPNQAC